MFSEELRNLLFQVIKSWQVIAVVVALVLYMSMVNYVLHPHHKPASVSKTKPKKKDKPKKENPKKAKPGSTETDDVEVTEEE